MTGKQKKYHKLYRQMVRIQRGRRYEGAYKTCSRALHRHELESEQAKIETKNERTTIEEEKEG